MDALANDCMQYFERDVTHVKFINTCNGGLPMFEITLASAISESQLQDDRFTQTFFYLFQDPKIYALQGHSTEAGLFSIYFRKK